MWDGTNSSAAQVYAQSQVKTPLWLVLEMATANSCELQGTKGNGGVEQCV